MPGAESKNPPQVAPILSLPIVHFPGVHTGVHQTDHRLAIKSGFEPLTFHQFVGTIASSALLLAVLGPATPQPSDLAERWISGFRPKADCHSMARGGTESSPERFRDG